MRNAVIAIALSFTLAIAAHAAGLDAGSRQPVNIAAQSLRPALQTLSKERNIQLVFLTETAGELKTAGAQGTLTTDEALARVLAGTGLTYRYVDPQTITIVPVDMPQVEGQNAGQRPGEDTLRLAQAEPASAPAAAADEPEERLEEILVTAQKRIERLQEVPVPVTALRTEDLANSNLLRLQDYYSKVPGLNLTPSTQSGQILSIRGISAGSGNPTVGVTVDDVPFGSATFLGGAAVVPDIDPADLARIEVLRGPQGTLYGASSIGGLLKFVTHDPSTQAMSGRVQGVVDSVKEGDGAGYSVRGSVNVPVNDTFAVRASAFTRQDPGFIDNPSIGREGVDEAQASGGRLAALWRPREGMSLKLGALFQKIEGDGSADVLPTLGELEQNYIRDTGAYERKVQAYSGVFTVDLGKVNLISVTGYNINQFADSFDGTFAFGPSTQAAFGVPGTPQFNTNKTEKFSEELRFEGALSASVDWLLGAFYTDEDSQYRQRRLATDPATGAVAGTVSVLQFPTTYEERALFGDLTFHLTQQLDLQLGARQGWIGQSYSSLFIDRFGTQTSVAELSVDTDAFTYLTTARYRFSEGFMTYVRLASGYRAGGPNVITGATNAPPAFDPDKSNNYEIGLKGDFLNRVLSVDASVYYIDWKDIQLTLRDPVTLQSFTDNAGAARSRGVELALEVRPFAGTTLGVWGAYNDAELTEAFPATSTVVGASGDRLPFGSKSSGNFSLQQRFPVRPGITGTVGGSAMYVGKRLGRFAGLTRDEFPSYTRVDLNAGLQFKRWQASVFVNNAADKRGVLAAGLAPGTRVYIQPRMIGLSLMADF